MQVKLKKYISSDLIFADLAKLPKEEFITAFINRIYSKRPELPAEEIALAVLAREEKETTAIGGGIAFPHCRLDSIDTITVAVGVCKDGIDYGAPDKKPVHLVIAIFGPNSRSDEYLYLLGQIARFMSDRKRTERIIAAGDSAYIYKELKSVV
ncbi:MAG: PTS sugar transporter subunit IIA [Candidatus Auribacterota bacterium]|jgi:mannitol/fructose-specific phosphotransferase system IIA component (Ntr-type)|nr:PTS sugar transporter subunit IIA [Candidatus Auribacterota bacterium]